MTDIAYTPYIYVTCHAGAVSSVKVDWRNCMIHDLDLEDPEVAASVRAATAYLDDIELQAEIEKVINSKATQYVVVSSSEDEYSRRELREYNDHWVAVHLRRQVGGGWYIKESITIPKAI